MPQVIPAIIAAVSAVGAAVGATGAFAFAAGAAVIAAGAVVANKLISSLYEMPRMDTDASRQNTVRSTVEPQKIIYGEALVSGPITFIGVYGDKNRVLAHAVALAGHEVNAITDIYFDNEVIDNSIIDINGFVTSGTFGPTGGKQFNNQGGINGVGGVSFGYNICKINKHLGAAGQTVDADLDEVFSSINSSHKGTGIAYISTHWLLKDDSQEIWDKYTPQNIKALVQGRKVYDPRTGLTAYSDNPALCVADYLTNTEFGMSVSSSRIDWDAVEVAADACDSVVDGSYTTPSGDQKRFTCNGVLFATDTHKTNINKLLSSMNGMLTYTNGQFVIRAGVYESPSVSLTEDDLAGAVSVKTSVERSDRFNTITGTFIDPTQNHKATEFPEVFTTAARNRDNGEILTKNIQLPMTNDRYMAQRIANKLVQQSDQQKVVTFPTNLSGVEIAVGDRVQLSLSEFNWTNKVFICLGWTLSDSGLGGVNLILREDDAGSYADPLTAEYSTITSTGAIIEGFRGVPDPQSLSATAFNNYIQLNWTNPEQIADILFVEVFASPVSKWSQTFTATSGQTEFVYERAFTEDDTFDVKLDGVALVQDTDYTVDLETKTLTLTTGATAGDILEIFNRIKIGETNGSQFIHDAATPLDPVFSDDTRWYWVRARAYAQGENSNAVSDRNPDSDTSTVSATVGRVDFLNVSGDVVQTGTTSRTLIDRLSDVISPEDFGAVGDGDTDDTEALQALVDYIFGTAVRTDTTLQRGHVSVRFPARRAYKITDTIDFGGQINATSGLQGGCQVHIDFNNSELYPAPHPDTGVVPSALRMHGDTGRFSNLKIRYPVYCTQDQVYDSQPTGVFLCPPTGTTPPTYSSNSFVTYDTIQVFGAYIGFQLEPDTVFLFKARFIQCDAKQCISWGWKMRSEPKVGISTTTIWEQCHVAARLTSAEGGRARVKESVTATSGQTVIPYTAEFDYVDDPIVYKNDVLLTRTTDYTVDLVAQEITLITGASAGDVIDIYGVYECLQTHEPDLTNKPAFGANWRNYWYSHTHTNSISSVHPEWSESTTRYYEDGKGWDIYGMSSATFANQCCIDGTNNREAGNGITCLQFGLTITGGFHWELPKMVWPDTPLVLMNNASLHIDHLYLPAPFYTIPAEDGNNLFISGNNSRLVVIEEARVVLPNIARGNLVMIDASGFGIVKTGTGIGATQVINLPTANVHGAFDIQRKITYRPQWEQLQQNYGGTISTVTPVTSQSGTVFTHNVTSAGVFNLNLTKDPEVGSFFKAHCFNSTGGATGEVVVTSTDGATIIGPLVAKSGETLCAYKMGFSFWYTTIEYNQNYGAFVEVDSLTTGKNYRIYSLGDTTQAQWNALAGTSGITYEVNDLITPVAQGPSGTTGRVGEVWLGDVKLQEITNTLPSASTYEGRVIRVSDDSSYGEVMAFSDGTNWIRTNDLEAVNSTGVIYSDSANLRVGINQPTPAATLDVDGAVNVTGETVSLTYKAQDGSEYTEILDYGLQANRANWYIRPTTAYADTANLIFGAAFGQTNQRWNVISYSFDNAMYFTNGTQKRFEVLSGGDTIFYDNSGVEGMRWDSSAQRLGIGVSSPSTALDVNGIINGSQLNIGDGQTQTHLIQAYAQGDVPVSFGLGEQPNTGRALRLEKVDNNDADPYAANFYFSDHPTVKTGSLNFFSSQEKIKILRLESGGDSIFYSDSGVEGMRWDASAQRLGIGVSSPATALDVNGTVTADGLTVGTSTITESSGDLTINSTDDLFLEANGNRVFQAWDNGSLQYVAITNGAQFLAKFNNNGDISFYDSSGSSQKFFWDASAERLGLGTTSPSAKLDVSGGDASINGLIVGKGSGGVSNNTAVGAFALDANTSGSSNTAIGYNVLSENTTGYSNTAIGAYALDANTTGLVNTAVGHAALSSNTTAQGNTAVGYAALINNTTGAANTAVGRDALYANVDGIYNSAFGYRSLYLNVSGRYNNAFGMFALLNSDADFNDAFGYAALSSNTTGTRNTAMGYYALEQTTTGSYNVAIGMQSNTLNTTSSENTTIGYRSGFNNTGAENTFIGSQAGYSNTTGSSNTFIGRAAGFNCTTGSNNTIIGRNIGSAGLSDTIILSAGTTERARCDSSGRWGLGTSSPSTELEVSGVIRASNGANYSEFKEWGVDINRATGYVRPTTGFSGTGNLQIGSSSNLWNVIAIELDNALQVKDGTNKKFEIQQSNDVLFFDSTGTEGMRWDASDKRLGIGVSAPTQALDLGSGSIAIDAQKGFVNSGSWTRNQTPYGYIDLGPANTSYAHIYTDRPEFYLNKEVKINGNQVWNAGNDGSGSGLDADTVDGLQASQFLRSDTSDTMSGNLNG
jgi:hypothetical protein